MEIKKEKTTDGLTDNYANFLKNCELESFEPEVREMFETAIERLYYSEEQALQCFTCNRS